LTTRATKGSGNAVFREADVFQLHDKFPIKPIAIIMTKYSLPHVLTHKTKGERKIEPSNTFLCRETHMKSPKAKWSTAAQVKVESFRNLSVKILGFELLKVILRELPMACAGLYKLHHQ
jgi:hypothetical protein